MDYAHDLNAPIGDPVEHQIVLHGKRSDFRADLRPGWPYLRMIDQQPALLVDCVDQPVSCGDTLFRDIKPDVEQVVVGPG
jgi:hypothetical protein